MSWDSRPVNTPETEGPTWTRLNEQIDWYNRKASTNQRQYKAIKLTQIVLGALVPVVAAINGSSRVILGALGAGVVVLEAIQQLFQFHRNWIAYRATCEALKREQHLFLVGGGEYANVPNPTAVRGLNHWLYDVLGDGAWVFSFVFLLLAVVSVVLRYRRSAGEERLQLKWFAWATAVSLGLIFALLPVAPMGTAGQVIYDVAIVAGLGFALPTAIGVAVLKYRLYAIDRIISRTVSYVLVTGLVVGVYLGCVALLTRVLPVRGSVGVAVSVLAAAALFTPLRRRVQSLVDQRFDRARYNAERVVTQFSVQLRDQVDIDVLGEDLRGVVDQVLAPAHLSLWLRDPGPFG